METTYDDEGIVHTTLLTPDDRNLSGEEFKIIPKITNIGSILSQQTSYDVTSVFQERSVLVRCY